MPGSESETASDLETLAEDLPTTRDDVEALRRARENAAMTGADIVRTLRQIGGLSAEELRRRRGPRGEPFELSDDEETT